MTLDYVTCGGQYLRCHPHSNNNNNCTQAHLSYMLFTAFENKLVHCLIETLCEQDSGDTSEHDPREGVSRLLILD